MAAVPQKTLNWLYNVLREYRDPNRTYSDLAQTLARYSSLAPRTDVYTFENGTSALLVHFVGTISVSFRGVTYRFPVALWIPRTYPYEAPMVYVTPTEDMRVRPGQHVAGDGRVYHHYLAHWRDAWDRSNIVDFLSILSDMFAKEPPVMSMQQVLSGRPTQDTSGPPPPRPPIPPQDPQVQRSVSHGQSSSPRHGAVPPPPPKQLTEGSTSRAFPEPRKSERYDAPPPLPSQHTRLNEVQGTPSFHPNGEPRRPPSGLQYAPQQASSLRQQSDQDHSGSRLAQHWGPQPLNINPQVSGTSGQVPSNPHQTYNHTQPGPHTTSQFPQHVQAPQLGQIPVPVDIRRQQPPPQQLATKPPPLDLLDSPFDVTLPAVSNLPAPPVPRNPEKDALLSAISATLTQNLHSSVSQNNNALPALHAQHVALGSTCQQLEAELANLTSLNSTLTANVNILQSSLQKSDAAIASSKERAKRGDVPKVDDMLTAPMVVGKQLYDVVCEERGIEAGIRALQDGLIRGRIGSELWARKTRELAREGFRKRVLAHKIGTGMGLDAS